MQQKPEALLAQMRNFIYGNWQTCITYAFAELGLADILKHTSQHVEELAIQSRTDTKGLYRFLRCCAQLGLIHIDAPTKQVTLTELGSLLQSDHPYSQRDAARLNGVFYRYEPWGKIVEVLRAGSGEGLSDTHKTGSLDFLQDKPELLSVFQKAMTNLSITENEAIAKAYDFSRFNHIIDIGAGHGTFIKSILNHNPHIKGTIFDLKESIATIDFPVDDTTARLSIAEGNFFDASTIPSNGDVYTMKNILHNWPEERVIHIMQSMHSAITAVPGHGDKRVLVIEHLMSDDDNTQSIVPWMDMNFFILVGGQDRTLNEYKHLFDQCSFTISAVIPTSTGRSIIELTAL